MYRKLMHTLQAGAPSGFNVEAFSAGSFEGEGDTRRLQLEEKDYRAVVEGPFGDEKATRIFTSDKGAVALIVVWRLEDPEQQAKYNLDRMPTKRQTIWLDITPNGSLDMGPYKNPDLNKFRDVFDLNKKGVEWKFQDFIGRTAIVRLKNFKNPDDPQNPFQNIVAVSRA